jgi:hypothetical protein
MTRFEDLDAWIRKFPKGSAPDPMDITRIQGPLDLVDLHLQRRRRGFPLSGVPVRETDVFGYTCKDTHDDARGTRYGGAPYRSKSAPWPLDRDGTPLTFIGQLDFSSSRDLTPKLPGEVLLLFDRVDTQHLYVSPEDDEECSTRFEWVNEIADSWSPDDTTPSNRSLPRFRGSPWRTIEYDPTDEEQELGCYHVQIRGTKIGGAPPRFLGTGMPKGYFAAFGSLLEKHCPLNLDVPRRRKIAFASLGTMIMFWEFHHVYLFLGPRGQVRWRVAR